MLIQLHIRHFAIVEKSDIEPAKGMTALTGETGAGKSILLDALSQVLGERATPDNVQQGAKRAEVIATFNIDDRPEVNAWLEKHDLDDSGECVLQRIIVANGKSRASINGRPVSLQSLKALGQQLVSIHGQHEHQALAQGSSQRHLLDQFASSPLTNQVKNAFDSWQQADQRLNKHLSDTQAHQQRVDLLRFQLQEFDALDTGGLDFNAVESEHRWLANADRLISLSQQALTSLDSDTGAIQLINNTQQPLTELVKFDDRLQEALDLVDSAAIQCQEAASLLRHQVSALEHDESRLSWLDERLGALHGLTRKHSVPLEQLTEFEQSLRDELHLLDQPEQRHGELSHECDGLREVYLAQAAKLTKLRKRCANKLAATITQSMQELAMRGGKFSINVKTDNKIMQRHGQDVIRFDVSPNLGVKPAPLTRIASGGELSRISLCVQLATIESHSVPTLIFDEVDAGIGGAVAETVGKLLRQVGTHAQVLCVTHLPQVAVQANHHLRVVKSVNNGRTHTRLEVLDSVQTRNEIARMLGGSKMTKKSQQHAQEMLDAVSD